jgi:hypothetical protein
MYRWLWQKLPGGKLLKSLLTAVILAVSVAVLFTLGFPALDAFFGQNPLVRS